MSDLKKAWKKTAKSMILAANDLGEAVIDSIKVGKEKVITWAQTEDEPIETVGTEVPADSCEEEPITEDDSPETND